MRTYRRKNSLRDSRHDYGWEGAYFLTLCAYRRRHLFGTVRNGVMHLNEAGLLAQGAWLETPMIRPNVSLGCFVVMPNHLHAIVHVNERRSGEKLPHGTSQTVGALVRGYKTMVTRRMRAEQHYSSVLSVWHRNYHVALISEEMGYERVVRYVQNNPVAWARDRLNGC